MKKILEYVVVAVTLGLTVMFGKLFPGMEDFAFFGSLAAIMVSLLFFSIQTLLKIKHGDNSASLPNFKVVIYGCLGMAILFVYNLIGLQIFNHDTWNEIHSKIYALILFGGIIIYFGTQILSFIYASRNTVKENDSKGISRTRSYIYIIGIILFAIGYVVYKKEIAPQKEDAVKTYMKAEFDEAMNHSKPKDTSDYTEGNIDNDGRYFRKDPKHFETGAINSLDKSSKILKNVVAVSSQDSNGFLARILDEGIEYVVYDAKYNVIASIQGRKLSDDVVMDFRKEFTVYKDGKIEFKPLVFSMFIYDEKGGGVDTDLGVWSEFGHIVPIYVLFDIDKDDNVVIESIYSAQGTTNPSHYHSDVHDEKYIHLINTFVTHIDSLRLDMKLRGQK